jgi:hypothetical protein
MLAYPLAHRPSYPVAHGSSDHWTVVRQETPARESACSPAPAALAYGLTELQKIIQRWVGLIFLAMRSANRERKI